MIKAKFRLTNVKSTPFIYKSFTLFTALVVMETATIRPVEFLAHLLLQLQVLLLEQLGLLHVPRLLPLHARLHPHLRNQHLQNLHFSPFPSS